MERKKILILYTSIGLGHKSIAENIGFYLVAAGFEVKLYDAHKIQGGVLAVQGKKLYQWMVPRMPFVWDWLYNTRWFISATLPYRSKVAGHNYNHILSIIKEFNPDAVISTHNTVSAIIDYLKSQGLYKGKFGIAFSDLHLHRFWLFGSADFYLANIEEQKQEMVEIGILPEKVFVCGVTLKPKANIDIRYTKNKFGIEAGEKVVLLASGSQGFGVDEGLVAELITRPKVKVIVLCGNNKQVFENLSNTFAGSNAVILSYHSFMDELYAIADIFITKPGGLSVSEALLWKVPILISHMLPGQEQHNYDYLQQKSLVIPPTNNVLTLALDELSSGNFKKSLDGNPDLNELFKDPQVLIKAVNQALNMPA
jgi:processive 1,2-diacylglycerol beta-glucosyltransferase